MVICLHEEKPIFKLRPDVHIQHKQTRQKIILDTKWKLLDQNKRGERFGFKDSDIQQMFAYSHYYLEHTSEVILIYPQYSNKFNNELRFKFNVQSDGAFLRAIPFDLENPEKIMTYISDLC